MIRRKTILVLILFSSFLFNLIFFILVSISDQSVLAWPLFDLGPAVIQDAYYGGAAALESPFGMIGVVPGGYSPYAANPLQNPSYLPYSDWVNSKVLTSILNPTFEPHMLALALGLFLVPIVLLTIFGRRSYGSAKTQ